MKIRMILMMGIVVGIVLKFYYKIRLFLKLSPGKLDSKKNIVISLTSYGRRVSSTVPYTVYSLFRQQVKPSKIILWLDEEKWNNNNIPQELKFLKRYGLEVRYCKDIRSYTKLIYTLSLCPNDMIITVDDDFIYSCKLVKELLYINSKHPKDVASLRYHKPKWKEKGKSLMPYNDWRKEGFESTSSIMATGIGGVLYPPGCFNSEVFNETIFKEICPLADDVWFWAMEIYNGTKIYGVNKVMYYPLDFLYQKFHKGTSLYSSNVGYSKNDNQIKAVLDHYHLWNKI